MMKGRISVSIIAIAAILLLMPVAPAQGFTVAQTVVVRDYWPTDEWQSTTPEEHGG